MNMRLLARPVTALVVLGLTVGPVPARADETIRCESRGFRYEYCRVDTDNRVELVRSWSFVNCREGRNWGYDRRGVWVDRGCAGEFRVGHRRSNDRAVVGAVVGLAALAAIAAARSKQDSAEVQSWAVGRFSGYDEFERTQVELNIVPGGSLTGRAGGNEFSGTLSGARLEAGRHVFRIERQGNGFVAIDESNAGHRVVFQRIGSGY